jgi:ADP-heptose:LPS heptosyltransferase
MIQKQARILIIRLSAIGDVIETLPAVHTLRGIFPNNYLAWVLESAPYGLLQGHPEIDEFIIFPKKEIKKAIKNGQFSLAKNIIEDFIQNLRSKNFDLAIDLQNLFKSGIVACWSGAKTRVGYNLFREGSKYFLTDVYPPPQKPLHFVDWQLELVHRLGAQTDEIKFILPDYSKEELTVNKFLTENSLTGPYFCLAPGTSWPNKSWTPEKMALLADHLNPFGRVVIIGSDLDLEIADQTIKMMSTSPVSAINKFNLRELAVLIHHSQLFLGGDTGPMHLAVAVGTRVVVWMGPTSRELTGPYQKNAIVISLNLPCQPCYKRKCKTTNCLHKLSFETVWSTVLNSLKE